jgi:CheY-like chemotaxis protein
VHETTNALTVILGWIDRAREVTGDRPDALAALEHAARYARSAKDAMRRAIGAQVRDPEPEPASDFSDRTLADLAIEAKRRQVTLHRDIDPACAAMMLPHSDAAWQVLTNLLLNAVAVCPVGGNVTLSSKPDADGWVTFHVRDDGPGVPVEDREDLFVARTSRRPGGAGIGLRHAHALASEMGGELTLRDDPTYTGAWFQLRWPTTDALPRSGPPSARPPRAELAGARVLILEDDAAVVELLELSLGARGADVTSVGTAVALDAALTERSYDVLLVDLSPLRGDELDQALSQARIANPNVEVVVISGSVSVPPRDDVVWVRKPFEPGDLIAAIAKRRR